MRLVQAFLTLVLCLAASLAEAASFSVTDIYAADGSTGNIGLVTRFSTDTSAGTMTFTSSPDNATFGTSLSSGVLRGTLTCATAVCGASGSDGYFHRRAPTGSTTISAVTFVADIGSTLDNNFGTRYFLVVIGDAATYATAYTNVTNVATSANATATDIAAQLDSYFNLSIPETVSSVSGASGTEGSAHVHTVTLSGTTASSQTFTLTQTNVTTSGSDYGGLTFSDGVTLSGSTLTVPAGVASFTVTVAGADDALGESTETYTLTIGGVSGTGTLIDDDASVSTVSSSSGVEGTARSHTVTLSRATTQIQTFTLTQTNVTTSASDYGSMAFNGGLSLSGTTLTVPAGVSSFTFLVRGLDDLVNEDTETYTVTVGGVSGTGTLTDNDPFSVTAVSSPTATEGSALVHSVSLSTDSALARTLSFSLSNVTTSGADYGGVSFSNSVTLSGSTLTIPAGVSSFTVTVAGAGDSVDEDSETYSLTIDGEIGTGTITDDDTLTVSGVAAGGAGEGGSLLHTVTLSTTASVARTFTLTLADVTTSGADYGSLSFSNSVSLSGSTLTIPAGVSNFDVTVAGAGDSIDEDTETYTLTIGGASGTGTITDDDTLAVSTVGDVTAVEGGSLVHSVTLNTSASVARTFSLSLSDVTTSGADYGSLSFSDSVSLSGSTLTIPAGVSSFAVTVAGADDANLESTETYTLTIGGVSGTGTITDDEVAAATVSAISDAEATEDAAHVHTVTLSGATAAVQTFTLTVTDVSTSPTDYGSLSFSDGVTLSGSTLTVPSGVSGFTVTFAAADDTIDENREFYTLTIGGVSATGAVLDTDTLAVTAISAPTATEGSDLVHTITLNGTCTRSRTFTLALTDVTSSAADYGALSFSDGVTLSGTTLTVPAWVSGFTVTVAGADDAVDEADETYALSIDGAVEGVPYSISGTGTITDDDTLAVASVGAASTFEGAALVHTVTLNTSASGDRSLSLSLSDVTTSGTDYGSLSFSDSVSLSGSTLTIPAGVSSFAVTLAGAGDSIDEETETYSLTIGGVAGTGTIFDDDTATMTALKTASLADTDASGGTSLGDLVTWTITVTNSGNVALSDLHISGEAMTRADASAVVFGPGDFAPLSVASLAAGASADFTATWALTQEDLDAGGLSNSAIVAATSAGGSLFEVYTDDDGSGSDATELTLSAASGVALVKTATLNDDDGTPGVSAGDSIDYAFAVTNTGDVTLTALSISDPLVAVSGTIASLAPGATDSSLSAHYILTGDDIDAGSVTNTATVTAHDGSTDISGTAPDNDTPTTSELGSIAGTVADLGGVKAGAVVRLIQPGTLTVLAETLTDDLGHYAFIGLSEGDFCIQFDHAAGEGVRAAGGTSGGTAVGDVVCGLTVAAGQPIEGVDAVMIDPSGVIYDAATRLPLAGATVTLLYDGAPVPDSWLGAAGDDNGVVTGADGVYSFLLQSPAQSGRYSLQVTAPGYRASTLIPAAAGALDPGTGLGITKVTSFAHAPARGEDATHYLAFDLVFPDWNDATSLAKGIVHNHIPLDPEGLASSVTLTLGADDSGLSMPPQAQEVLAWSVTARNDGILPLSGLSLADGLGLGWVLQAQAGVTGDGILDPGEVWTWTASLTLGARAAAPSVSDLATLTATDDWGAGVTLESSPSGNATPGVGQGSPTLVAFQSLVDQIRPELRQILRDDLHETLTRLSGQFAASAKGAGARLALGQPQDCAGPVTREDQLDAHADDRGARAQGHFGAEVYDCARHEWRRQDLTLSWGQSGTLTGEGLLAFTSRAERFASDQRIAGRFWGLYGSQGEVTSETASGRINGLGLFGGVYGAESLGKGSFEHYLGLGLGRHRFALTFQRGLTIAANGDYTWGAVFAGGALSRQLTREGVTLTPRLGLDVALAPGAKVHLAARADDFAEDAAFGLDAVGFWRASAELGIAPGEALVITPGLFCEGGLGVGADCGAGLTLDLGQNQDQARGDTRWSLHMAGEVTPDRHSLALGLEWSHDFEALDGRLDMGADLAPGGPAARIAYRAQF